MGLPLAMAALPLYVHLPRFYGEHLGVGLAALGGLLLVLRLADGLLDPLLGAWSDRARSRRTLIALSVPVLAAGMVALFAPQVRGEGPLLGWLAVSLALVYVAFSLATINHSAWGAELSSDPVERTRITAVREGLALGGVVIASLAPAILGGDGGDDAGLARFALLFVAIAFGCLAVLFAAPEGARVAVPRGPLFAGMVGPLAIPCSAACWPFSSPTASPPRSRPRWCSSSWRTCFRPRRGRGGSSRCTSSPGRPACRCGFASPPGSARCARGCWRCSQPSRHSCGPRSSARATRPRSPRSACFPASRWAPTSRCRRRSWPT